MNDGTIPAYAPTLESAPTPLAALSELDAAFAASVTVHPLGGAYVSAIAHSDSASTRPGSYVSGAAESRGPAGYVSGVSARTRPGRYVDSER